MKKKINNRDLLAQIITKAMPLKKFTVHLMHPYVTWEDVEARDENEAIAKCMDENVPGSDCNEVQSWLACSEDEEDE